MHVRVLHVHTRAMHVPRIYQAFGPLLANMRDKRCPGLTRVSAPKDEFCVRVSDSRLRLGRSDTLRGSNAGTLFDCSSPNPNPHLSMGPNLTLTLTLNLTSTLTLTLTTDH